MEREIFLLKTFTTKSLANDAIKKAPVTDMDYSKGLL